MKDFFNKLPKLEIGLVVVFLILLLWGASGEASELDAEIFHASNAGSARPNMGQDILYGCYNFPKLRFCAGLPFASGEYTDSWAVQLDEQLGDYRIGVGYVSEQTIRDSVSSFDTMENMYVTASRIVAFNDHLYTGIGLTYWQNTNRALGSNLNFGLQLGWRF